MKTLLLIRHAEAGWGDFGQNDMERTLTSRGLMQADDMAKRLKEKQLVPDRVCSSTAIRAEMTAQRLFEHHAIQWDKSLYLAEPDMMLQQIKAADDDVQTLAIVAHNPGISALADALSSESVHGMAPCTVAVLPWDVQQWSDIKQGAGELSAYLQA